jgi:hypothetical protein
VDKDKENQIYHLIHLSDKNHLIDKENIDLSNDYMQNIQHDNNQCRKYTNTSNHENKSMLHLYSVLLGKYDDIRRSRL